jgi:hypothetical protein
MPAALSDLPVLRGALLVPIALPGPSVDVAELFADAQRR